MTEGMGGLRGKDAVDKVIDELANLQWASLFLDADHRLIWVSDELKALLEEEDEGKLGYGKHILEAYMSDTWADKLTPESHVRAMLEEGPYMLWSTPGGKTTIAELFGLEMDDPILQSIEPAPPPPLFSTTVDFVQRDMPPIGVSQLCIRVHDLEGAYIGNALVYGPALPARLLAFLARGDEEMYQRMGKLVDPGRRQAAILFADLEGSSALSRKLPSAAYFQLIRNFTTAIDKVVIDNGGIVGKHAGDGATAFFLTDDLGSSSAAARAAIQAARRVVEAAGKAADDITPADLIDPSDCRVKVGVHWGGTLFMGQLVTGGRLEVTALGDEVNECARIQEAAEGNAPLVSKVLIEHLTDDDARAVGLEPDSVLYKMVNELSTASDKAKRDAGGIPVTRLP
jgi:class 3 adenylate cyclase